MSKKQEVAAWKPREFEGTDLLPMARSDATVVDPSQLVGRDNIDAEDLVLPSFSLLQGMSQPVQDGLEGAQPGKFFHETMQTVHDGPIRMLVVHHFANRAAFPGAYPWNVKKRCISRDGVEGTEYGLCEGCPHKEWVDCGDGKQRQPCARQHNFVAMTDFGPVVLRMRGHSFKAAKKFVTGWEYSLNNLWDFPMIVTATKGEDEVMGQKTTFYKLAIRWEIRDPTPAHVREQARVLFDKVNRAHEAGKLQVVGEEEDPL